MICNFYIWILSFLLPTQVRDYLFSGHNVMITDYSSFASVIIEKICTHKGWYFIQRVDEITDVSWLMNDLDHFNKTKFVLGSNNPSRVHKALLRPARMHYIVSAGES